MEDYWNDVYADDYDSEEEELSTKYTPIDLKVEADHSMDIESSISDTSFSMKEEGQTHTIGEQIAHLCEKSLNNVRVHIETLEVVQGSGFVQGGSECVKKFSALFEDLLKMTQDQYHRQFGDLMNQIETLAYVDDIAVIFDPEAMTESAQNYYNILREKLQVLGMKFGHEAGIKDGCIMQGKTKMQHPPNVQNIDNFTYLGVKMMAKEKYVDYIAELLRFFPDYIKNTNKHKKRTIDEKFRPTYLTKVCPWIWAIKTEHQEKLRKMMRSVISAFFNNPKENNQAETWPYFTTPNTPEPTGNKLVFNIGKPTIWPEKEKDWDDALNRAYSEAEKRAKREFNFNAFI